MILDPSAYIEKSDLGRLRNFFFGLPFLPFQGIQNTFGKLVSICPDLSTERFFSDYILRRYMNNG